MLQMSSSRSRVSAWSIFIFILAIALLGFSIAELILEQNVIHAFRNINIQYPNSNLAEGLWISLNPENIDPGPTIAITVVGAISATSAIAAIGWVSTLWWGVGWKTGKTLGIIATMLAVISTAICVAIMTYTFIAETKQSVPEFSSAYLDTSFTREFYLCSAFPALFSNAEQYYGFPACEHAEVARFNLVGLSVLSAVLTALCTAQLWNLGSLWKWGMEANDVEKNVANRRNHHRSEANEQSLANSVAQAAPALAPHERALPPLYGYYAKV